MGKARRAPMHLARWATSQCQSWRSAGAPGPAVPAEMTIPLGERQETDTITVCGILPTSGK